MNSYPLETECNRELVFAEVPQSPCVLSGLPFFESERVFCRVPQASLQELTAGVAYRSWQMSGVQLRFRTNSSVIAIRVELKELIPYVHMPFTGTSGFDLYVGVGRSKTFLRQAVPIYNETAYTSVLMDLDALPKSFASKPELKCISGTDLREFTLFFPLYNGIKKLELGLVAGASLEAPAPFSIERPVLIYGSSITQGCCCSRPGNSSVNHLSRKLDANFINYGFHGSAVGDAGIARVIASIDNLSAFIMDYDWNALTSEELLERHEPFFRIVREKHPDIPVLMLSRPNVEYDQLDAARRREVIYRTYENAVKDGDRNVYFVDGVRMFGDSDRDACTEDTIHPNDIGYLRIANTLAPILQHAIFCN